MKSKEEVVKEMQLVVEQMRLDDIEENPDCENEFFTCDACGGVKSLAGSVQYGGYRLCNDCVLFAEVGFELGQIKNIEEANNTTDSSAKLSSNNYKRDNLDTVTKNMVIQAELIDNSNNISEYSNEYYRWKNNLNNVTNKNILVNQAKERETS